jgi:hypothetical protein
MSNDIVGQANWASYFHFSSSSFSWVFCVGQWKLNSKHIHEISFQLKIISSILIIIGRLLFPFEKIKIKSRADWSPNVDQNAWDYMRITQGDMSVEVPQSIKTGSQTRMETKACPEEESICSCARDLESFVWSSSTASPNEVHPESRPTISSGRLYYFMQFVVFYLCMSKRPYVLSKHPS